jgi:hypothetical protein
MRCFHYFHTIVFGLAAVAFGLATSASAFVLLSRDAAKIELPADGSEFAITWNVTTPDGYSGLSKWRDGQYADDSTEEITRRLMQEAIARWSAIPGSLLRLSLEEDENETANRIDGVFSIEFVEDDSESTAGGALPIFDSEGSKGAIISDCDITIDPEKSTPDEIGTVITHEIGHCLGLGHPHTSRYSIMSYARDREGDPWLSYDDKAAILYLYPDPDVIQDVDSKTGVSTKKDLVFEDPGNMVMCGVAGGSGFPSPWTLVILAMGLIPALKVRRRPATKDMAS